MEVLTNEKAPPAACAILPVRLPVEMDSPCEFAWTSFDTSARTFYYSPLQEKGQRIHPTQKPVALYEWLLMKYAKEGWRILDTHLGSGSSRIAAYNLGFEFVGCEIEPTYFRLQEQRFADHTAQERMW